MRQRGFTLVEILVAVVIIGVMIIGVTLSVGLAHGDKPLEDERDRILALADHFRDQAALQVREYGLRAYEGGYQFLYFDPRSGQWRDENDDLLRPRKLPDGITMRVWIEGRPIVIPDEEVAPDQRRPQMLFYSSGEVNLFELELRRVQGPGVRITHVADGDRLVTEYLEPERR